MFRRFLKQLDDQINLKLLSKIVLVLLIVYLLKMTFPLWGNWLSMLKSIITPFFMGFLIAYIVHPLIVWMEKKGINKTLAILIFWICIIILIVLLCLVLMPMLYDKISGFISNLIWGVHWISDKIIQYGDFENFDLVDSITNSITKYLSSYDAWLPNIMNSLPGFMNSFLNVITNALFTVIIAIYMLSDFERVKGYICKFARMFYEKADPYLFKIDEEVSVYLKSLLIIMAIKFVEYSLFYFLIGHEDWVIIGLLTAVGQLVPYLGGTLANSIGIITALSLSPIRIFFLIAGICVLSNVDAYVISPLIHEKRSSLGPLVTLFAVFAGGVVYGALGIMFSIPLAIAIKAICEVYARDPKHQKMTNHDEQNRRCRPVFLCPSF